MTRELFDALPQNFAMPGRSFPQEDLQTFQSFFAIGPLLFVGVPGELSAEWGLHLKWVMPRLVGC